MSIFKRRHDPPEEDLWGPQFAERRVPLEADSEELNRLVLRLQALVDVRAPPFQLDHARAVVADIETIIVDCLESPTKHRDWRQSRPRVLELLTQLVQILYQQVPTTSD